MKTADILKLIQDGEQFKTQVHGEVEGIPVTYVIVDNPNYAPDRGNDPYHVIEIPDADLFWKMFRALRIIQVEPHELSHEKIEWQRNLFKKLADQALAETSPDE